MKEPRNISLRTTIAAALLVMGLIGQPSASAQSTTNQTTKLGEVEVKEKRISSTDDKSYTTPKAETATWTDTPIAETPFSIQAIPVEVIQDQGLSRLKDVYRNVSGVAPDKTEGYALTFENAFIRGFAQRLYVDGVNLYGTPTINLAGIKQVEVLKGPSSTLYGAMEVGGLINIVPKTPLFSSQNELSGEFGSFNFYRGEFDSTGPINSNLAYRVVGSVQDSDSFRDFIHNQSEFFAPSMTWNISDHTQLTGWLWYQHAVQAMDDGVAFTYRGKPVEPIEMNRAGSDHNTDTINDVIFKVQLDHAVTEDFTLHEKFVMHEFDGSLDAIRITTATTAANRVTPYYDASSFDSWDYKFITDALWKFDLGPTQNKLLFGADFSRWTYEYMPLTDRTLPSMSIFNPVEPVLIHNPVAGSTQENLTQGVGGFVQEEMTALDKRLHFLVGGRADYVDQWQKVHHPTGSAHFLSTQDDTGLSGRVGVMYDATSWMSPYANVARSFNPNGATTTAAGGKPLDPETGLQYEGGFKFNFFEKRLALTTAAYQIVKDNVAIADPNNPGFSLNGGTMRSQGFEMDLLGQITPELQAVGCYAYTDTTVLKSSSLPVGSEFRNIPENSGSFWLKYNFLNGPLKNFGVGTGLFMSGAKSGDNTDSFDLPGYMRWDAAAWYTIALHNGQQIKLQLNVFNLTDKTYYESSQNTGRVEPGTPLSFMGKCTLTF